MHPEVLQDVLRQELFADASQWWDNRWSKVTSRHPHFKHKTSKVALWLTSRQTPAWVDSDAGRKRPPDSIATSVQGHGAVGMCRMLCEDERPTDDLDAVNLLVQRGCHAPKNIFYRVLKRCIANKDLVLGRRVHALTVESGYEGDAFLATQLITLYASQGRLQEATRVFLKVSMPNAYNWASIIFAYARHGEAALAIRLYKEMRESAVQPDNRIYVAVVKACAAAGDLVAGKEVHAHILSSPRKPDIFVQTALLTMYAKCGCIEDARNIFDRLSDRNVVTWTAMIAGYAQQGMGQEALGLYDSMSRDGLSPPDSVTFVCLLQACASVGVGALHHGQQLGAQIAERGLQDNVVLGGSLVNMYAKCGSLKDARIVFDRLPERNVVTWTTMIAGYVQHGMGQKALSLYRRMQQEGLYPRCSVAFICLLQACARVGAGALHEGKALHAQIEKQRLQADVVLGCSLVNMYAKCGSLADARGVFDILPVKNMVTWNAMIAGYVQHGRGQEALTLYDSMQQEGLCPPTSATFVCLLQACPSIGVGALHKGKQLHAQIEEQALQYDVVIGGSLVNMYVKCGSVEDARGVFDRLQDRNIVTWTAMIAGYSQQGMGREALILYTNMQQEGLSPPDSITIVCLLQACASVGVEALLEGKQLHAYIKEQGLQNDVVLGGSLVNMYAKCNSIVDARSVFDSLPDRSVVTWTAMIAGYAQRDMGQEALNIYSSMQEEGLSPPDSVTFVCLLQACASVGIEALLQGKQLHAHIKEQGLQDDPVLGCSLVNMYANCGSVEDAHSVFDRLSDRNVETWTVMIAGYAQLGMVEEAFILYTHMQQDGRCPPNSVTFVCLLQACASVGVVALQQGKLLHAHVEEQGLQDDVVLGGSLVNMYVKCGSVDDARSVFDRLTNRNVITWTAMIAGYAHDGMGHEALSLYNTMQQEGLSPPDSVTFLCLLQACASVGSKALDDGKQLHAQIEEQGLQDDVVLGGSLISMYWRCGSVEDARRVFDKLPERNVATWAAMIAGYAQQGSGQEVLNLYSRMQQEGLSARDSVTFVYLLQACAVDACLPLGKQLHAEVQERGMQADVYVGAALVNMYAKCGSMSESQQVFDSLPNRNIEAWGALIGGYTRQGNSEVVFDLLDRMRLEGIEPNGITCLSVLTVCSHVGLVNKGRKYFEDMRTAYGISPTIEHYTCMMDLLGRAGHLEEALQMARTMPFPPNRVVWHTLLGACLKWNNVEIGQQAFGFAVSLDGKDAAAYVLMSNIYARSQMWEEATEVQARRKNLGAWKKPGQCWWTDVGGVMHRFVVGETRHPQKQAVYGRQERLGLTRRRERLFRRTE